MHMQDSVMLSKPLLPPSEKSPMTKSQKKNARKKQRRKEQKSSEETFSVDEELTLGMDQLRLEPKETRCADVAVSACLPDDSKSAEVKQKKIRSLKKKIKRIEELEVRLISGEILEREQLLKIMKKEEYMDELSKLDSTF